MARSDKLPLFDVLEGRKRRLAPRDRAPDPLEWRLQQDIVKGIVEPYLRPTWRFTHVANGELRDKATAGKLRGMGVRPGFFDLLFLGRSPRHLGDHWMEVKRNSKEKLTPEQEDMAQFLMELQLPHVVVWSIDMAWAALESWDALKIRRAGGGFREF